MYTGFPGGSNSKKSACNAGDPSSIPGSGRSPGQENGNPLHIYIHMAALGLRCCAQAFSSCGKWGLLCCGALASYCSGFSRCGARALGTLASALWSMGLVALRHGGSSWTRDGTCIAFITRWIPNHWTITVVPRFNFK